MLASPCLDHPITTTIAITIIAITIIAITITRSNIILMAIALFNYYEFINLLICHICFYPFICQSIKLSSCNNNDNNISFVVWYFFVCGWCSKHKKILKAVQKAQTQGNCLSSINEPVLDPTQIWIIYAVSPSNFGHCSFFNFLF